MSAYYLGAFPVDHDLETPNAMPPPWASAWGPGRGWPVRTPEARVGPHPGLSALWSPKAPIFYQRPPIVQRVQRPTTAVLRARSTPSGHSGVRRLGALGQWEDVGAWEDMSGGGDGGGYEYSYSDPGETGGGGSYDYPEYSYSDPGEGSGGGEYEAERPPPQDEPEVYEIERPPPQDEYSVFSQESLDTAASQIVASIGTATGGGVGDAGAQAIKLFGTTLTALAGVAPAILKGLFPAGIPPLWTPCPKGTYWNGKSCSVSPTACPTGTIYTGTTCRPISLADVFGFGRGEEGGGEGEGGGEFGGFFRSSPQLPITSQWWFWPVLIGGGGLIVLVAVRRR